jgi:hypothetical protein
LAALCPDSATRFRAASSIAKRAGIIRDAGIIRESREALIGTGMYTSRVIVGSYSSGDLARASEGILSLELLNSLHQGLFELQQTGITGIEVGSLVHVLENGAKCVAKNDGSDGSHDCEPLASSA